MLHGGLRYLEHGRFALVRESLAERAALAAHGARARAAAALPRAALPRRPRGRRWMVRAGLALYDALAGRASLAPHASLDARAEALALEPGPRARRAARAPALYSDVVMDDARLAVAVARDAAAHGAAIHTYTEVAGGAARCRVGAVELRVARRARRAASARSRRALVVNATGAWADAVRARLLARAARRARPIPRRCCGRSRGIAPRLSRRSRAATACCCSARRRPRVLRGAVRGPLAGRHHRGRGRLAARADGAARPTLEEVRYLRARAGARAARRAARARRRSRSLAGVRPLLARGRRRRRRLARAPRGRGRRRCSRSRAASTRRSASWRATRWRPRARRLARARGAARATPRRRCRAARRRRSTARSARRVRGRARVRAARSSDVVRRRTALWLDARPRPRRGARAWRAAHGAAARLERRAHARRAAARTHDALARRGATAARRAPSRRRRDEPTLRAGDRPGHHRHHRARCSTRAARVRGRGYAELPQHFPQARLGRARRRRDLGAACSPRLRARSRAARAPRRAIARDRHHEPARDHAAVGPRDRRARWRRAIVWQDRRTAERCDDAAARAGSEPRSAARTGLVLDPYFSATKLEWLLAHAPRAARAARARAGSRSAPWTAGCCGSSPAARVHATDPTNASRTLLFDIARARAGTPRCSTLFGVPASVLPEVLPSSGEFGAHARRARACPTASRSPASRATSRRRCSARAASRAGQSKNTYGTGCFLLLHTGAKPVASRSGLLTTVACGPRGEPGLRARRQRVHRRRRDAVAARRARAHRDAPPRARRSRARCADSGGVVLVPAFVGLGAPYWRPDVRGALFGLTRGTTRAHVVRATLESIAFQSRDLVEAMARDAGRARDARCAWTAAPRRTTC